MLKSKKILIALLFLSCLVSFLHADEEKKSSLYYVKLGAAYPPGGGSVVLPSTGLGVRFQKDCYGFDVSANVGSMISISYASLKGVFLFYPQPEKKHQLYVGIGPGVGYHLHSVSSGKSSKNLPNQCGQMTIEGVLGYEFRHAQYFKTFIQLELSQPAFWFGGHGRHNSFKPGIVLTGGIGF